MTEVEEPLLSVCMISYNQRAFIEQAVKSALAQKSKFRFEIVVGDDSSTDGTAEILGALAERNPEIRLTKNPHNLGMMKNFIETLRRCRGRYVALLEGDDYWISPDKIQNQVDFLEAHRDFSSTFHRVVIRDERQPTVSTRLSPVEPRDVLEFEDLARENRIFTASCIFRKTAIHDNLPSWVERMPIADWPLHLLNSTRGKTKFFNDVAAVYRIHSSGSWEAVSSHIRDAKWLTGLRIVDSEFPGRREFREQAKRVVLERLRELWRELGFSGVASGVQIFREYFSFAHISPFGIINFLFWDSFWRAYYDTVDALPKFLKVMTMLRKRFPQFLGERQCPICKVPCYRFKAIDPGYLRKLDESGHIFEIDEYETLNTREYLCENCGATDRDRLIWLYIHRHLENWKSQKLNVIDFSPSHSLRLILKEELGERYQTADIAASDVDLRVDITNMPSIRSNSIDFLICSHVLEHVCDSTKAVLEIRRILKPGAQGLVMVPLPLSLTSVLEGPDVASDSERWKYFGQDDHVRMFSKAGFLRLFLDHGFAIEQLGVYDFGFEEFLRAGVTPQSVLYLIRKP